MPWIKTVAVDDAQGRLKALYAAAIARAGRVFGIVRSMSLAPGTLQASMGLYRQIMFQKGGLSRFQRELIAVVVSRSNGCHY